MSLSDEAKPHERPELWRSFIRSLGKRLGDVCVTAFSMAALHKQGWFTREEHIR